MKKIIDERIHMAIRPYVFPCQPAEKFVRSLKQWAVTIVQQMVDLACQSEIIELVTYSVPKSKISNQPFTPLARC